jgi:signal peptidase II
MGKLAKIICTSTVAAMVVLLDQLSKWLVLKVLTEVGQTVELLPFFHFTLSFNHGISFSMFNNPGQNQLLLLFLSGAVIILFYAWLWRSSEPYICIPLGIVTGGALGNMIDRVAYGAVVDFIDVKIISWHYPTFNIADSFICIGVALLIFWPAGKRDQD